MVMEKVQEIKRAEERADAIIRRAQEKAGGIATSLEAEINALRDVKEKHLSLEVRKYAENVDKKTEERITLLKQEYFHKSAGIKERSERRTADAAENVWKELKEELSMP